MPVYITHPTLYSARLKLEQHLIRSFTAHHPIELGKLSITPFPKFHDAADPYSFIVCCNEVKVGIFTDIGIPCKNVIDHFQLCNAAFLETNYDDTMLDNGRYPFFLKSRIRGDKGHLSNKEALRLFSTYKPSCMSHLVLSHLSKNNNAPELVQQLFDAHANGVKMIVASRYRETPVFYISHLNDLRIKFHARPLQLSFSFA